MWNCGVRPTTKPAKWTWSSVETMRTAGDRVVKRSPSAASGAVRAGARAGRKSPLPWARHHEVAGFDLLDRAWCEPSPIVMRVPSTRH